MTRAFAETLAVGLAAEEEWARHLARRHHVLRVHPGPRARLGPRVRYAPGDIIAPDIIAHVNGQWTWFEVKSKDGPGFRWKGPHRGWEHGVDLHLFRDHYRRLARKSPFYFVVREDRTPPRGLAPGMLPPAGVDGRPDWGSYRSGFVAGPVWLYISFSDAEAAGHEEPRWTGGKEGFLWPRAAMTPVVVP